MEHFINLQPILQGRLVIVEPLGSEHYDVLYDIASDEKIWEQHPTNHRHTQSGFSKFFKESINSSGALLIRDRASRRVIGSSRYKLINAKDSIVEIGWTFLARDFWGGKYNRELKKLMVNHVLDNSGTVVLYADRNNLRSQLAISKVGGVLVETPDYKYHHPLQSNMTFAISQKID